MITVVNIIGKVYTKLISKERVFSPLGIYKILILISIYQNFSALHAVIRIEWKLSTTLEKNLLTGNFPKVPISAF